MKTISLHQPWASAIALGLKRNETRSWPTNYRGPLAIHAAKKQTANLDLTFFELRHTFSRFRHTFDDAKLPTFQSLPFGCIVATCDLIDCVTSDLFGDLSTLEFHLGNYAPRRFVWKLDNICRLVTPIPCKGRQGFFNWDHEIDYNAIPVK